MAELQLTSIPLTKFSLGLHNDFHNQASNLMLATGAEVLHIASLLPRYNELVAMENSIVKRQTTYVSTEQLQAADQKRDTMQRILLGIIDYHARSSIAAKAPSAQALQAKCANYRDAARSDYRTETRELNGLIAVLSTEESTAELATLHLTDELAELARLNATFDILIQGKQQEAVERMPQTDISTDELRQELDEQYAAIVKTVNAYAIVQPTEEINTFITNLNAIIMLVKQSASTLGKESGEEEPETVPENTE